MLFLALENAEMVKFTPPNIPTTRQKNQQNFQSLPLGEIPLSLNIIWKNLHAVSKVIVMKRRQKEGYAKEKDMPRANIMWSSDQY